MNLKLFLPLLLLLGGCSGFGSMQASGKPVSEAYAGNTELRVLDTETPLRREKRLPVLSTPEVLAVYVPAHAEPHLLVGDHYLYLKLSDPTWFTERLHQLEPPTHGDAPAESLRPLREAEWNKVVIPSKP
jgi:hypothetical protein